MHHDIGYDSRRPTIGAILRRRDAVSEGQIDAALRVQAQTGGRLGEIMVSRGWVDQQTVTNALAEQASIDFVALQPGDLDPRLGSPEHLGTYLRYRLVPWYHDTSGIGYAAVDPREAAEGLAALEIDTAAVTVHLVTPDAFEAAMIHDYAPLLAQRAARRCPAAVSARSPMPVTQRLGLFLLAFAVLSGAVLAPGLTLAVVFTVLVLLNAMNAVARIAVLGAALRRAAPIPMGEPQPEQPVVSLAERRAMPRISLLVPLLREPEVLPLLLEALEAIDWPHDRLEVLLLLEAGDSPTVAALRSMRLPSFIRYLILPPGQPKTKPRALNLGLDFARGDIVGIYDAEDRPEPDQLRRVARLLAESPPEVAAVQCRLSYYNPRENWLTRCFAIEYAMWFDVLIAGFRDLRLPIPLGGTSVFFRRHALNALGGWDAHNVTEDADLGMRLARQGWRCEVSVSTTFEEANSRALSWIRQRSRWLKGYMMTFLVHMRRPRQLWSDLGARGVFGFLTVFLGAIVAYLGLPLFWTVWGAVLLGYGPEWLAAKPLWAIWAVGVVQLSGWLAMFAAALIATFRRGQGWLTPWVLTLVFYWPIGALSAYLALVEMLMMPSFWRKTDHGIGRLAQAELARVNAEGTTHARAAVRSR